MNLKNQMKEYNAFSKNQNLHTREPYIVAGVDLESPSSLAKTKEHNQWIKNNNPTGEPSKIQEQPSCDINKESELLGSSNDNQLPSSPPSPNFLNIVEQLQMPAKVFEDYEDEQFEYEYDDLLVKDILEHDPTNPPLPSVEQDDKNLILISEDPPFTEEDLEDFINNKPADQEAIPITPEGSFHSIQNSLQSNLHLWWTLVNWELLMWKLLIPTQAKGKRWMVMRTLPLLEKWEKSVRTNTLYYD